jgi:hypothetical protein
MGKTPRQPKPKPLASHGSPRSLQQLQRVGPRPNVIQIVPSRHVYRPAYLRAADREDHELVTSPLASPTGPGGAAGFRNRAGSQIATLKT